MNIEDKVSILKEMKESTLEIVKAFGITKEKLRNIDDANITKEDISNNEEIKSLIDEISEILDSCNNTWRKEIY